MYTRIREILQECGDLIWRVSDCEELVGRDYSQEMVRLVLLEEKAINDYFYQICLFFNII